MTFIQGSIANKIKRTPTGSGFVPGSVARTMGKVTTKDLDTSESLYNLASQSGLKGDADRILRAQSGEEVKKIFSGGFISDIFDVLNALQYGVTGTLKGKGFMEGVRTRQSFSDKDALGDNGLPGVIAGIALDIAVDPLTYIAPATILKKVPLFSKIGKAAKGLAFGKKATKTIDVAGGGVAKAYQAVEGGTKLGKWLSQKLVWMSGADPVFRETYERSVKNIAQSAQNIADMTKGVSNLAPETAAKLLTRDETGRFARVGLDKLKGVLNPEEFKNVSKFYTKLDDLGKEAVDLKLLKKGTYEDNLGQYLKNAYTEYEQKKGKGVFGIAKVGIKGIKARKTLTPEQMAKLGQIDDPAYLLFKSTFDLMKDVENAKLFNMVAKNVGTDIAQEGFKQLPKSARLFTSATGGKIEAFSKIKNLNKELKPVLSELKKTFKADKAVLSEVHKVEKLLDSTKGIQLEEFKKFFQEGDVITKATATARKLGTIPDNLVGMAEKVKKFKNLDELLKSKAGIELEKLFEEGVLQRSGFNSVPDFFNIVKKPFKSATKGAKEVVLKGDANKIVQLQKAIEGLSTKAGKLRGVDKRSIDDSYRFLEDTISKITGKKEELVEVAERYKLGELAGKYIPENMYDYIQEISEPVKYGVGKKLVANFKFFKVVMNPATHARNIVSNSILNWWKLGIGPWNVHKYADAAKEVATKGKWYQRASKQGLGVDNYVSNEIFGLLDSPEALGFSKKLGSKWSGFKKTFGNIYQGEEGIAKLVAFKEMVKKGMTDEAAFKAAESATFNYAQVTPFIRKLRTSLFGFPFITFTVKATPIAVETAIKAPHRISAFGKIKNAIENLADIETTARERASEPPWIRDGFYIKLPIKDKHGRSSYFDLTYIIPFGDLVSGNFIERQTKRITGTKESIPEALAGKSPVINFIKEISRNQDFYGNQIWRDSDSSEKQLGDLFRHFSKTYLPPLVSDQIPGGYNKKGERQQRGILGAVTKPSDEQNQKRTLMQEMLRQVGVKIQPIDVDIQETYQEWNKKKALGTLLREKGITSEFKKTYIPK